MDKKITMLTRPEKPLHPHRCGTCAHFELDPDQSAGQCVAQFPVAIMGPGPGGLAVLTYFPVMKPEQRCAHWKDAIDPSVQPKELPCGHVNSSQCDVTCAR